MSIKLHLGSGKRQLPGYVHVDLADFSHIDHRHQIDRLPMFEDNVAELIYCCHAFEYFDRQLAVEVLAEWGRVLKPGGLLRLAVPDFAALVEVYQRSGELDRIVGPLFGRWPIPGTSDTIYHRTVYDFSSLQSMLENSGFSNVVRWDPLQVFSGETAGYDDYSQAYYPHMDSSGILISLNLQATRND